jgi:hypothetical protein
VTAWEYQTIEQTSFYDRPEWLDDHLNALGRRGWEAIAVLPSLNPSAVRVLLKREVGVVQVGPVGENVALKELEQRGLDVGGAWCVPSADGVRAR